MQQDGKATFIQSDGSRTTFFDVPEDELDEFLAGLEKEFGNVTEDQFANFVKPKKDG